MSCIRPPTLLVSSTLTEVLKEILLPSLLKTYFVQQAEGIPPKTNLTRVLLGNAGSGLCSVSSPSFASNDSYVTIVSGAGFTQRRQMSQLDRLARTASCIPGPDFAQLTSPKGNVQREAILDIDFSSANRH